MFVSGEMVYQKMALAALQWIKIIDLLNKIDKALKLKVSLCYAKQ